MVTSGFHDKVPFTRLSLHCLPGVPHCPRTSRGALGTHVIIQRATDVSPVDGRDKGKVLPVLALQVIEVLVPWGTVPGKRTAQQSWPWGSPLRGAVTCALSVPTSGHSVENVDVALGERLFGAEGGT